MPFVYPIHCCNQGCTSLAEYKIASCWTDGLTEELKTYGLTCAACLPEIFRASREKQKLCRLAQGEILETPGIYRLTHGKRDDQLHRLVDLESQLLQRESASRTV